MVITTLVTAPHLAEPGLVGARAPGAGRDLASPRLHQPQLLVPAHRGQQPPSPVPAAAKHISPFSEVRYTIYCNIERRACINK